MQRSIEAGLVQHHDTLKYIIQNLGKSNLEINTKEMDAISLDEAFKNMIILFLIGILTSFIVWVFECVAEMKNDGKIISNI